MNSLLFVKYKLSSTLFSISCSEIVSVLCKNKHWTNCQLTNWFTFLKHTLFQLNDRMRIIIKKHNIIMLNVFKWFWTRIYNIIMENENSFSLSLKKKKSSLKFQYFFFLYSKLYDLNAHLKTNRFSFSFSYYYDFFFFWIVYRSFKF